MKRTEWYKNAVVYQIYPFSFKDDNNDGWGDIAGILSKLDYLKDLGITAIWFSPLYKSPDYDYGYDIADYKDIDPKFGTLDDFKVLLKECHNRDIKVIMDMAINHSSIEHKWFKEALKDKNSPYRDYYIIREGIKKGKKLLPPNNWDSTFTGSAWAPIEGTDEFYMHLFCVEQADLNWENENVRKEAVNIFNYWMEMGVDGFRLDVFNMFSKVYPLRDAKKQIMGTGSEYYIDGPRMHEFLKELNEKAFSKYDSYTVGESYNPNPTDAYNYVKKENNELDTIFNFAHLDSDNMAKFFKTKFNLKKFKEGLFNPQIKAYGDGWNTLVLENHDNERSNCRFAMDTKKYHYEASTFLPTITFLGFGTPFIYMGEEFGQTNEHFNKIDDCKDPVSHFIYNMLKKFGIPENLRMRAIRYGARDNARVPMRWDNTVNYGFNKGCAPWQSHFDATVDTNCAKDMASDKSIYKYYQKVLKLKKESAVATNGNINEFDHNHKQMVVYTRELNNNGLLIMGNFSNKEVKYTLPADLEKLNKKELLSNYDSHNVNNNTFILRPYEAIVYSYKK